MSSRDLTRTGGILRSSLVGPAEAGAAATVVSEPVRRIDEATERRIADAHGHGVAEGYERGVADGRAQLQAAAEELRRGTAAQLDRIVAEIAAQHAELAAALELRVLAGVRAVLAHEPDDEGRRLASAVRRAVERVEAPRLTVRVAPDRLPLMEAALAGLTGLDLEVDTTLGSEDVRLLGDDVDVDLRRSRLLEELELVLAAGEPLGPVRTGEGDHA